MVPPVPTEMTIASISPPVCSQISGPVDAVVRLRVVHVRVLVGLEAAGDLLGEPVGDGVVALRRVVLDRGRRDHDLGAVGAQERDLLLAHLVRHDEDAAVALDRGRDGEADAGVARRSARRSSRRAGASPRARPPRSSAGRCGPSRSRPGSGTRASRAAARRRAASACRGGRSASRRRGRGWLDTRVGHRRKGYSMKITVIGRGNVGGGLAKRWRAAGHEVQELGRDGGDASAPTRSSSRFRPVRSPARSRRWPASRAR